ncbi:MAG: UDP-N-acetylmuramoyl-L-alanine--D-glutamate ligase [Saprospiraceae bacterium]|nr:UDP-N-acetylmuramoyl-L-alanine--D-glutamate ligase [Saprospiraceae bacterium]
MAKRMVVLGGGESGAGAALLGAQLGYEVFVSDKGSIAQKHKDQLRSLQIEFEEGRHSDAKILNADVVVKSPGIPSTVPLVQQLVQQGTEVIGEVELASRFAAGTIIAITGSNGKTTTTNLIYHILKNAGRDVAMVGNVGASFAGALAQKQHDIWVVEVSSFQLDDCNTFKPHIAVLTNITPDHLNRYEYKLENYAKSKMSIAQRQDANDFFIHCPDDEITKEYVQLVPIEINKIAFSQEENLEEGAYRINDTIYIKDKQKTLEMSVYDLSLQGRHNVYNSMAAAIVANVMGIRKETIRQSLQDFQNLEHRMESVAFVRGIQFINDSKATNVNSTWYALESMTKKVVWIAGGVNKGNDYSSVVPLAKEKVSALICLGTDNAHLKDAFGDVIPVIEETQSMAAAVKMGYYLAKKDEAVLLSPACASFDLFSNYEDRGNQFKQFVREL